MLWEKGTLETVNPHGCAVASGAASFCSSVWKRKWFFIPLQHCPDLLLGPSLNDLLLVIWLQTASTFGSGFHWPNAFSFLLYLRKGYISPITLSQGGLIWSPGGHNWVISSVSSTQPPCLRLRWATVWQYVATACVCVSCSTENQQITMGAGIVQWGLWGWVCVCETESFYWLHVACLRLYCLSGRMRRPKPCVLPVDAVFGHVGSIIARWSILRASLNECVSKN